jgi:hypothetical protein
VRVAVEFPNLHAALTSQPLWQVLSEDQSAGFESSEDSDGWFIHSVVTVPRRSS